MKIKICSSCKSKFDCKENLSCWCYEFPHVPIKNIQDNQNDCICPKCLKIQINH